MTGPIYQAGQWWHQRPDGGWWKWSPERSRWEVNPAPPPSDAPTQEVEAQGYAAPPGSQTPYVQPTPRSAYLLPEGRVLPPLARWWQRLLAWLVDAVMVGIASGVVLGITKVITSTSGGSPETVAAVVVVLYLFVIPAYFVTFHATSGATLGKRLLRIRVCDKDTGATIGFGRAYVRSLVSSLLLLIVYLLPVNYLWPLWDPQKQAWHDKAVNSVVLTSPR